MIHAYTMFIDIFSICHANLARCIVGITSTNHAACVYRMCADQLADEDFIIGGVFVLATVLVVACIVTICILAAQNKKADGTSEDIEGASNASVGE